MTNFFIDQHGCAKNQTDGELIAGYLISAGYEQTFDADKADFIIINSCGFIESAKKESIDAIYQVKSAYPDAAIVLTGCLAQRYAETLKESIPELDGIFGNGDLSKVAEFMAQVEEKKKPSVLYPQMGVCAGKRPVIMNFKGSVFVKITEGCSNHCSFCAIPLIRGEVRSRPVVDIIQEIQEFVQNGVYEINLIGQDLAAFSTDGHDETTDVSGLSILLKEISRLEGDFLVRLLYIHPDHFNPDILPIMKNDSRFAHYFDIPFQSGDTDIIHAMNRKGSKEGYIALIDNIRRELPDCVIRTTFLTGFPGESDSAADNTKDFLNKIKPEWSGCFPYSREEDTPAYDFKPRVPKKVAQKRADDLEEVQSRITSEKLQNYVGKELLVLVEEIISVDENSAEDACEGLAIGRSWFQAPEVDGCVVIRYDRDDSDQLKAMATGNVVKVRVIACTGVDFDSRFEEVHKVLQENTKIKFIQ